MKLIPRNRWPGGGVLAFLCIFALGLSPALRALQAEQAPPAATSPSPAKSANDPGATQSPSAQPAPPATSQTQPVTAQTLPANDPDPIKSSPKPDPKHPQNDRIFFALPNYLTVEQSGALPPLTTREKFKTVAQGCFDPIEAAFIGIQAGIGQADNTNPTYGQGFVGYSKRFGTAYTDAIIGNFGTGAIFPALLRQDPRYYQRGTGNFFRRAWYASLRVVITRSDSSGRAQFNLSEFLGNGMAAGLANAYHPGPHTIASSTNVFSTQMVMDVAGYELKEFWPDLHRLLLRLHHRS